MKYYGAHPLTTPAGVADRHALRLRRRDPPVTPESAKGLAQLADRVVDVLELELASRRLNEVNARLSTANERLEHFAGQVSHDLKNPLTSVSLSLESLELDVTDADQLDTLARARRGVDRMDGDDQQPAGFASQGAPPVTTSSTSTPSWRWLSTTWPAGSPAPVSAERCRRARRRRPAALGADEPRRQRGEVHRRRRGARDRGRRRACSTDTTGSRCATAGAASRPTAGAGLRAAGPPRQERRGRRDRSRDLPPDRGGTRRDDGRRGAEGGGSVFWFELPAVGADPRRPAGSPRAAGPASSAARRRRCRSRCRPARR